MITVTSFCFHRTYHLRLIKQYTTFQKNFLIGLSEHHRVLPGGENPGVLWCPRRGGGGQGRSDSPLDPMSSFLQVHLVQTRAGNQEPSRSLPVRHSTVPGT